jgi:hypothetical protein
MEVKMGIPTHPAADRVAIAALEIGAIWALALAALAMMVAILAAAGTMRDRETAMPAMILATGMVMLSILTAAAAALAILATMVSIVLAIAVGPV